MKSLCPVLATAVGLLVALPVWAEDGESFPGAAEGEGEGGDDAFLQDKET
jgi:hypothetical protein